jgi:hypothetical protein
MAARPEREKERERAEGMAWRRGEGGFEGAVAWGREK